jgi:hypothetical protein
MLLYLCMIGIYASIKSGKNYNEFNYSIVTVIMFPCFHYSSDESSWKRAKELLIQVATHGENTGYEIPCLIVSAKDDLDPYPLAIQDSTRVCFFCLLYLFSFGFSFYICSHCTEQFNLICTRHLVILV